MKQPNREMLGTAIAVAATLATTGTWAAPKAPDMGDHPQVQTEPDNKVQGRHQTVPGTGPGQSLSFLIMPKLAPAAAPISSEIMTKLPPLISENANKKSPVKSSRASSMSSRAQAAASPAPASSTQRPRLNTAVLPTPIAVGSFFASMGQHGFNPSSDAWNVSASVQDDSFNRARPISK